MLQHLQIARQEVSEESNGPSCVAMLKDKHLIIEGGGFAKSPNYKYLAIIKLHTFPDTAQAIVTSIRLMEDKLETWPISTLLTISRQMGTSLSSR